MQSSTRVFISEMKICVTVSKDSLGDGTLGYIMSQSAFDALVLLLPIADNPVITSADCCFLSKGWKESTQEVSSSRGSGEENSCISFQSAAWVGVLTSSHILLTNSIKPRTVAILQSGFCSAQLFICQNIKLYLHEEQK